MDWLSMVDWGHVGLAVSGVSFVAFAVRDAIDRLQAERHADIARLSCDDEPRWQQPPTCGPDHDILVVGGARVRWCRTCSSTIETDGKRVGANPGGPTVTGCDF